MTPAIPAPTRRCLSAAAGDAAIVRDIVTELRVGLTSARPSSRRAASAETTSSNSYPRDDARNRPYGTWSPRPDSNRGPFPYQGNALPPELRGRAALRFYLLDTDGQIHVRHRSGARQGQATAASSDACAGLRRACPRCPARRHANLGATRTRR